MLVMLLLVLLQVPARTPVEKGAEHLQAKELARLSTGELALGYPLPNNQRGESASVSAGWNPIALELHRRLELGDSLRGEEWRSLLVGKGYVHLRPRWPAGVPLAMRVERPWILLDGGISMQPELSTRAGGLVPSLATVRSDQRPPMCGEGVVHMLENERRQVLGLVPRGSWHLDFHTEIEQSILDSAGHRIPGLRQWSGVLGLDIEIVDSVDEVVPPDRDERWTRMVRSGLHILPSKSDDERRMAWLELDLERASWPAELQAVFEVELMLNGAPCGTGRIDTPEFPGPPELRIRRSTLLERLPWPVAHGDESANGWSVCIRGVRHNALYDWDLERWWAGEFEVPLADLIRR